VALIRKRPFLAAKKDYLVAAKGLHINLKEATPQQLELIRETYKKQRKEEIWRGVFIALVVLVAILLFMALLNERL